MNDQNFASKSEQAIERLLQEGIGSYLDALYAMQRFKREVTDKAITVLGTKLAKLIDAMAIPVPRPMYPLIRDSVPEKVNDECDGTRARLIAQIWFPEPIDGNCRLSLHFERDRESSASCAVVRFGYSLLRARTFHRLRDALCNKNGYWEDQATRECGFGYELTESPGLESEFNNIMDYAIKVWGEIGGWQAIMR